VPSGDPPGRDDPAIAAARARGEAVVVRVPDGRALPAFLTGWQRDDPSGSSGYATYLPPADR
jgi:hypothetical protein